jgi:hypothetical protein
MWQSRAVLWLETGAGAMGHVIDLELSRALVTRAATTRHVVTPELPCVRRSRKAGDTQVYAHILRFIFDVKLIYLVSIVFTNWCIHASIHDGCGQKCRTCVAARRTTDNLNE